jgi:hypothetical protein
VIEASGKEWHEKCFVCSSCSKPLTGRFANIAGKLVCPDCARKPAQPAQGRSRASSVPERPSNMPISGPSGAPSAGSSVFSQQPATGQMGLLQWVRNRTDSYGLEAKNWTKSWADGLLYCALLHSYHPELIDYKSLKAENAEQNIKIAYEAAAKLGIPELLDPEDFALEKLSMMTQMSEGYRLLNK